jgi:catecholate siderophore receptor
MDMIPGKMKLIFIFMLLQAAAPRAARAENPPAEAADQAPRRSEEVTVVASAADAERIRSATRTDTPVLDVPQAIGVVTRTTIEDQRMRGMADVVRYVPGAGIAQGEGNRDTPVLRGNSTTADFFVDGVRDDLQYFRDLYNVERVEVLKGPSALAFGRGGAGGVINRVPREAGGPSLREATLQAGAWDERRVSADVAGRRGRAAGRLTAVFEDSGSYRDDVGLQRYGLNPTLAVTLGDRTTLRAGYEHFHDRRTADRGVPSWDGRPLATDPGLFFGSPDRSVARATVDSASVAIERRADRVEVTSRLRYAAYDKYYRNVFPGAVAAGERVELTAYDNATARANAFSQTDVVVHARTGPAAHTLLLGTELGRQVTDNLRNTGYFTSLGPAVTAVSVPVAAPTTALPLEFRPSATDADNHGVATTVAAYAQDQLVLAERLHLVAGLRYDRFGLDLRNNRTGATVGAVDGTLSPRLGVVVKPRPSLSLYASRSRSFVPRAGEQLASLTASNRALAPEEFRNDELGLKWDFNGVSLTAAAYRLVRGNVAVADPVDPAVTHLVDGQRARGIEAGASGALTAAWSITGGYAYQDGEITRSLSPTAPAGARLAQLPRHSFALWNRYALTPAWAVGLGVVHRGEVFTSTDNRVTLPAFTRVDAALFAGLGRVRAQANLENLLDARYWAFAHSNNNITPGAPRALRLSLTTRF